MIGTTVELNYFKGIAKLHYIDMVVNDYGIEGEVAVVRLTEAITEIYRFLDYGRFEEITIYCRIEKNAPSLSDFADNWKQINSFDTYATLDAEKQLVIEVVGPGQTLVSVDRGVDVESIRANSLVYRFFPKDAHEVFLGRTEHRRLAQIPQATTYFALETYKDLDIALEDYGTKVALESVGCRNLSDAWFDLNNRIFFKPGPEHLMRDSLTTFLKARLRNAEIRPEQVVDKSHPVDIKVTWSFASHLALIEIKWLGKSLEALGKRFTKIYSKGRGQQGADQLKDYLDSNAVHATEKITRGYLVIFDARRWNCNNHCVSVTEKDGMHFSTEEVPFEPDYSTTRSDFSKPFRFFMKPICQN